MAATSVSTDQRQTEWPDSGDGESSLGSCGEVDAECSRIDAEFDFDVRL